MPGIELEEPRPLLEAEVAEVHDPYYVRAVRTGENRASWPSRRDSLGTQDVADGPCLKWRSSGGSPRGDADGLLRIPVERLAPRSTQEIGRRFLHVQRVGNRGQAGFRAGAKAVLILDLDAHCGGGTSRLIAEEPRIRHLDVAVDNYDGYRADPPHTLDLIDDAEKYLPSIRHRLEELGHSHPPFDLCLYNAGIDPFEGCATGGLKGINEQILAESAKNWSSTGAPHIDSPLPSSWLADTWDGRWMHPALSNYIA